MTTVIHSIVSSVLSSSPLSLPRWRGWRLPRCTQCEFPDPSVPSPAAAPAGGAAAAAAAVPGTAAGSAAAAAAAAVPGAAERHAAAVSGRGAAAAAPAAAAAAASDQVASSEPAAGTRRRRSGPWPSPGPTSLGQEGVGLLCAGGWIRWLLVQAAHVRVCPGQSEATLHS